MHNKQHRHKDYFIDARIATAKKGRKGDKNVRSHNTQTPISHSVSYNHHKYQKEVDEIKEISHKNGISNRQMKMMIRCMQEYCNYNNESCQEVAQKYKITSKLFQYLQRGFELVGNEKQIKSNKSLLQKITPIPSIRCEYCQQLGHSCNQYQGKVMRQGIQQQLHKLQEKLMENRKSKEQLQGALKSKEQYQDAQSQLEELKRIIKLQKNILKQYIH